MDSKPVPYVQRGSKKYIVDHHHTLAALELSGFDVEITLEQVRSFDKTEQTLEGFWGYLEGRGWAFLRDENYNRIPIAKLPKARDCMRDATACTCNSEHNPPRGRCLSCPRSAMTCTAPWAASRACTTC